MNHLKLAQACRVFAFALLTASNTVTEAQTCHPYWSAQFAPAPGAEVMAVYDDGSGNGPALYCVGRSNTATVGSEKDIMRFDGEGWSVLGGGLTGGEIFAMTGFDDGFGAGPSLYVGGYIATADGLPAPGIARWNGKQWSAVGSGLPGYVRALAVFDDHSETGPALFAGGWFSEEDGSPINRLMKWDGSTWSPILGNSNHSVHHLAVFDDGSGNGAELYASGHFPLNDQPAASRIAKWNGTRWEDVGQFANGVVNVMLSWMDGVEGPGLYIGGSFTTINGVAINRLARWDGHEWSAVGGLVSGSTITTLAPFNDGQVTALYVGGSFHSLNGLVVKGVARLDENGWSQVGDGLGSVRSLCWSSQGDTPHLYATAQFVYPGVGYFMAEWDGKAWKYLGNGIHGNGGSIGSYSDTHVYDLAEYDDGTGPALYAAGDFAVAGSTDAKCIAKWNGQEWSPLFTGITGTYGAWVNALEVFDDGQGEGPMLYAGGYFNNAGGIHAYNIARWNGTQWLHVGSSPEIRINVMAIHDDGSGPALYAGGEFGYANGNYLSRVVKLINGVWLPLGADVIGTIDALQSFDDGSGPALYAGGKFAKIGAANADNIAKWNGQEWAALGVGIQGNANSYYTVVWDMVVYDDGLGEGPALYVGGVFNTAGGLPITGLARWNGAHWSSVGSNQFWTYDLAVFDDGLDNGPALYVSSGIWLGRWSGTSWSYPEGSVDFGQWHEFGEIWTILPFDDGSGEGPAMFAAGRFSQAGDVPSQNIAKYVIPKEIEIADLNGDCIVNSQDLVLLISEWGNFSSTADVNSDNVVNVLDLILLISNWS